MIPLQLEALLHAMPIENAVRIELRENVPVFRASSHVQERIEALLEQQRTSALTPDESRELTQYEELDDFLSLVNRLIRNEMETTGRGSPSASAA